MSGRALWSNARRTGVIMNGRRGEGCGRVKVGIRRRGEALRAKRTERGGEQSTQKATVVGEFVIKNEIGVRKMRGRWKNSRNPVLWLMGQRSNNTWYVAASGKNRKILRNRWISRARQDSNLRPSA